MKTIITSATAVLFALVSSAQSADIPEPPIAANSVSQYPMFDAFVIAGWSYSDLVPKPANADDPDDKDRRTRIIHRSGDAVSNAIEEHAFCAFVPEGAEPIRVLVHAENHGAGPLLGLNSGQCQHVEMTPNATLLVEKKTPGGRVIPDRPAALFFKYIRTIKPAS